jgi:pantetheine-phosphate adenylyltransferase
MILDMIEELVSNSDKQLVLVMENVEKDDNLATSYAILKETYQQLTNAMLTMHKPSLNVQVLLSPHYCHSDGLFVALPSLPSPPQTLKEYRTSQYPVVAIGGTFDHLHAGHKLMLSVAALLAMERIVVGITDEGGMLKQKQFKEHIESWAKRAQNVQTFLTAFSPSHIAIEIVKLTDPYGPTTAIEGISALVVSHETLDGGRASKGSCLANNCLVNRIRRDNGISELELITVDLINIHVRGIAESKLSSTLLRSLIACPK